MKQKQQTLENFFAVPKSLLSNHPTDVYLFWSHSSPKVEYTKQIRYKEEKRTRYLNLHYVCADGSGECEPYTLRPHLKMTSFLKSNLQKAVRRQNTKIALASAMCINQTELLRRLPIIMIEDTALHESFSVLVWFMMADAKGGFVMRKCHWEYIMGVISWMCSCPRYDRMIMYTNYGINDHNPPTETISNLVKKVDKLPNELKNVILSLMMREKYGGMKGDMNMIVNFMSFYTQHGKLCMHNLFSQPIAPVNLGDATEFCEGLVIPAAIDQHCCNIATKLHNKFKDVSEYDLKKALWYGGSYFNHRCKRN